MPPDTTPGQPYPLGATVRPGGVNFSVFSKNSTGLQLLLFDDPADRRPRRVITLDSRRNRTFYYWHVFVPGLAAGQLYAYRAEGPFNPAQGNRFDAAKTLVDPYAHAVAYGDYSREAARRRGDNCAHAMKSVVVDPRSYDWEGDVPIQRPFAQSVIYELHVGGFTRHATSGVAPARRGTYAGLAEKIPYLRSLGVTAVELLPVQQFDPQDVPAEPPVVNYWGYSPVAMFAPHREYSSRPGPLGPVGEFRDMVKALHRAGIEVILDVVFNHTAEGAADGPTLSFRGLENRAYYLLDTDLSTYLDYTGCGNTFNGNHSIVRRLILDCLRYWVQTMHVDGFRFDLASVLARDEWGQPAKSPPVLWEIESDPVLAGTKIIAEAWDAAGLYQVGSFVGHRWAEWNGQFRDDVRRFVKSDADMVARLAGRVVGSRDLYPQPDREPNRSINFVACHDGFTLRDLVTYNEKHNQDNPEGNRGGTNANWSWNCGVEGPTDDPQVRALRQRQMRNLLTILFLSAGTPMLQMGDEVGRSQGGNNNAYALNAPAGWFDWSLLEQAEGAALLRFTRGLIAFTQGLSLLRQERFWENEPGPEPYVTWHGVQLNQPDWGHESHSLAFSLTDPRHGERLHVLLNAYWEPLAFELPPHPAGWRRVVDTSLAAPDDFAAPGQLVAGMQYTAAPRSAVVLRG